MVWLVGLSISCWFKLVVVINQGKFSSDSCSTLSKSSCSTSSVPSAVLFWPPPRFVFCCVIFWLAVGGGGWL
ncbi:hypothetical protein Hdeb2414_s0002g00063181 [Helianthus debilis subsp. tardiflorus]